MKQSITLFLVFFLPLAAIAGDHDAIEKEVRAAAIDFNDAYEANDIERYFSYYTDDAVLYWSGERQDVGAYYEEWRAMIEAGEFRRDLHLRLSSVSLFVPPLRDRREAAPRRDDFATAPLLSP